MWNGEAMKFPGFLEGGRDLLRGSDVGFRPVMGSAKENKDGPLQIAAALRRGSVSRVLS